ncbi:LOW QUALITY PROTEIN: chymotrypsin-like protease CTRL-1 [Leptosomus discolor]
MLRWKAQPQLGEVHIVLLEACGVLAQLSTLAMAPLTWEGVCPPQLALGHAHLNQGGGSRGVPGPWECPAGAGTVPGQGFTATQRNRSGANSSEMGLRMGSTRCSENHRIIKIMEYFGFEGTTKIIQFQPLAMVACLALASTVSGCGVPIVSPSVHYSERIINGQNAVPGSWPWQVSLQSRSGSYFCGSSLINKNWVVTAAHCNFKRAAMPGQLMPPVQLPPEVLAAVRLPDLLTSHSPYSHVVNLGPYDHSSTTQSAQVKTMAKAITNPSWNPKTLNNDITLLKLSSPIQLGPHMSPVSLAPANLVLPTNLQCVTTGWGRINPNSQALAVQLQQVTLPLISQSQCVQYWGNWITSSMLCAGGAGASSCHGDCGRPLVYRDGNVWTSIGTVSWGTIDCNIHTPAVYTRVSQFNWINYVVAQR